MKVEGDKMVQRKRGRKNDRNWQVIKGGGGERERKGGEEEAPCTGRRQNKERMTIGKRRTRRGRK